MQTLQTLRAVILERVLRTRTAAADKPMVAEES
jgi:hypothetical protein